MGDSRAARREAYDVHVASLSTARFATDIAAASELESPCNHDEVLWERNSGEAFCTPLCGTDDDCPAEGERCVGPDFGLPSDGESVLWENVELADGRVAYGLCDPFAYEYDVDTELAAD